MPKPIDIDVWTWSLSPPPAVAARLTAHLTPDEEARARRYVNPLHGDQYRAGRGRLREILGGYVNERPAMLPILTSATGKPTLAPGVPLTFNLSHTRDFAALAVTRAPIAALGLDIEAIRPIEHGIAQRFFSAAEVAALEAHSPQTRTEAFYRCWTRKEAFVKAQGEGLGFPLDAFDVSLTADAPPALLRLAGSPAADLARWHLVHLSERDLTPGVIGAIAIAAHRPMPSVCVTWHRNAGP